MKVNDGKENYFIYNKENIITGMKTLNGVFYGDRESCIKFKHKIFNLIAESLDIQNKFSFPKQNIDVKTDGGIYTITPNDIRLTEEWIFEHYKNQNDGNSNYNARRSSSVQHRQRVLG